MRENDKYSSGYRDKYDGGSFNDSRRYDNKRQDRMHDRHMQDRRRPDRNFQDRRDFHDRKRDQGQGEKRNHYPDLGRDVHPGPRGGGKAQNRRYPDLGRDVSYNDDTRRSSSRHVQEDDAPSHTETANGSEEQETYTTPKVEDENKEPSPPPGPPPEPVKRYKKPSKKLRKKLEAEGKEIPEEVTDDEDPFQPPRKFCIFFNINLGLKCNLTG